MHRIGAGRRCWSWGGRERCRDDARLVNGDADVEWTDLLRQALVQSFECPFRSGIRTLRRQSKLACNRSYIDDAAAPLFSHRRYDSLDASQTAKKVCFHYLSEKGNRRVFDITPSWNSRVVDQDVDLALFSQDLVESGFN